MNTRSHRNPDVTRQELLRAAFDEIYEYGFQGANLDRVLQKTRVTKGALYHHFANKHALGLAVVDEVIAPLIYENRLVPVAAAEDPLAGIIAAGKHEMECLDELQCRRGCPLNNLIQEMSPIDAEFRNHLKTIVDHWSATLANALKRGQQAGYVRHGVDCEGVAVFIIAIYTGIIGLAKIVDPDTVHAYSLPQAEHYLQSLRP